MNYRGIGALLLAVPLSAAGASFSMRKTETAIAGAAPMYLSGSDGAGAIPAGEKSPIEVESAHLRFSLAELPETDFIENAEKFKQYSGKFTAEYTYYNPTDEDCRLDLVLPLGLLPEYYPCPADPIDRTSLGYAIRQDGRDVACKLRHTLDDWWLARGGTFDLEEGLDRLYPDETQFYRDDLPVTVYEYNIEVSPSFRNRTKDQDYVNFALSFAASAERTRVICSDHFGFGVKDGKAKITCGFDCVENERFKVKVFVLGEDISKGETYVFRYQNGGIAIDEDASVTLEGRETTTFSQFALSFREEGSAVSDADWKNAFLEAVEEKRYAKTCCSEFVPKELGMPCALMQWFEYSLDIPAKSRVVSSVTAPIYPALDGGRSRVLYDYHYLLSPAQKWAKFGQLTVDIDTPYYIFDSSLGFEKREGGYTLTRDMLPLGELDFTLSEEEWSASDKNLTYSGDHGERALTIAIVILCVVGGGIAVVVTCLAVRARTKKKRREEEEKRLLQARPQEGKIDLPDEENGQENDRSS